jgi:MYXO-CTERM domain-containing protein
MRSFLLVGAGAALAFNFVILPARDARACGGCFHPETPTNETPSVVVDHRMAFSISKTQTILWDQVRYAGNPAEFAWVLPVRPGTEVEVGRDEFLNVLDTATAPIVAPPVVQCYYPPSSRGGGGGGGFGCGTAASSDFSPNAGFADAGSSGKKDAGVLVVSEKVVGPYETAILHSNDGQAITDWLVAHAFVIPASIGPIIAYYTNQGMDFVAIRLRPDVGTRAMQPIRIVSPGADGTLPLRMVSAGIGAKVGLELFVISEGRYEATSFANALVDPKTVKWDGAAGRSTYTQVFDALAASNAQGVWITEYAGPGMGAVKASYLSACQTAPPVAVPCDGVDAGASDGGDAGDASTPSDAGTKDAGCVQYVSACEAFDDVTRATAGMYTPSIMLTRLRTNLPAASLGTDLKLGAAKSQEPVTSIVQTTAFTDPSYDPCPGGSTTPYPSPDQGDGCQAAGANGSGVTIGGLGALALVALARRRRRS